MMINWLERHLGLVLECCGAGHFCRSAISRYNTQCETLNICCFFFLPTSSTGDSPSHHPRHWRRAGDPAACVFISFLKTTISWIMTGHVAWHSSTEQTMLATYTSFCKVDMFVPKKILSKRIRLYQYQQTISHVINVFRQKKSYHVKGLDRDLKSLALTMVCMF